MVYLSFCFSFGMYMTKVKQKQINQKGGQKWQIQKIQIQNSTKGITLVMTRLCST